MSGLTPAGSEAQGVLPLADADYTVAVRPTPAPGRDGRDWLLLLEIDAYQKAAT